MNASLTSGVAPSSRGKEEEKNGETGKKSLADGTSKEISKSSASLPFQFHSYILVISLESQLTLQVVKKKKSKLRSASVFLLLYWVAKFTNSHGYTWDARRSNLTFQCIPHHPKPKANIQILYSRFTEKIPLTPETVASFEAKWKLPLQPFDN